jgi:hypothetical protein
MPWRENSALDERIRSAILQNAGEIALSFAPQKTKRRSSPSFSSSFFSFQSIADAKTFLGVGVPPPVGSLCFRGIGRWREQRGRWVAAPGPDRMGVCVWRKIVS